MRMLEKWAVIIGGGVNHRYGLYDMVMLKDNHVDFAGGIEKAVHSTQEYLKANGLKLKIEVETRNLDEVQQALDAHPPNVLPAQQKMKKKPSAAIKRPSAADSEGVQKKRPWPG